MKSLHATRYFRVRFMSSLLSSFVATSIVMTLASCGGSSDSGGTPVARTVQSANDSSSDPPDASVAADTAHMTSPVSQAPVAKQTQAQVSTPAGANLMPPRNPNSN